MLSWSVFFLFNSAFALLIGFSHLDGPNAMIAKSIAMLMLAIYFGLLWIERRKGNTNF